MVKDSLDEPITYDENGQIMKHFDILKKNLHYISNLDNENIKAARWNTYYYKKYKAQNRILIFIIVICVLIFILTHVKKIYPYFDKPSYLIIVGAILAISILILIYLYIDIFRRDNMNFDEFDYGPGEITRMQAIPEGKNYIDASGNECKEKDPRNLANSKFISQIFS